MHFEKGYSRFHQNLLMLKVMKVDRVFDPAALDLGICGSNFRLMLGNHIRLKGFGAGARHLETEGVASQP